MRSFSVPGRIKPSSIGVKRESPARQEDHDGCSLTRIALGACSRKASVRESKPEGNAACSATCLSLDVCEHLEDEVELGAIRTRASEP